MCDLYPKRTQGKGSCQHLFLSQNFSQIILLQQQKSYCLSTVLCMLDALQCLPFWSTDTFDLLQVQAVFLYLCSKTPLKGHPLQNISTIRNFWIYFFHVFFTGLFELTLCLIFHAKLPKFPKGSWVSFTEVNVFVIILWE